MKISRGLAVKIQYVLDQWVPPRIRDSKFLMQIPMKLLFKESAQDFMLFKNSVFGMTKNEFGQLYERTSQVQELQGETDLNQECIKEILNNIRFDDVLEVGCGRGYLANKMNTNGFDVTACDIVMNPELPRKYPKVKFVQGNIEKLPFKDNSFSTVVCTHTLEHVQNLNLAISELRRVAKKELIIVVPKQRPYKYTFSLHTQFFPYDWSIMGAFGYREKATIKYLGDWFYYEKNPHK